MEHGRGGRSSIQASKGGGSILRLPSIGKDVLLSINGGSPGQDWLDFADGYLDI